MKLAIVGGSAPSTPHLFLGDGMRSSFAGSDVTLVGRSTHRLAAVARAIETIGSLGPAPRLASFDPVALRGALRDADVVLIQVRCGGYAGRAFDETFPLRYGICGDEGLGPGGLSAAWRSWPEICGVFDAIGDAAPRARVLLLTSPVSLLVRCVRSRYPTLDTVGICELPWATLQEVCAASGVDALDVSFEYAGVNHLGWFGSISAGSRDIVDEYADGRGTTQSFPSGALIRECGGIPLKYLRLHYERETVVREQRAAPTPRGTALEALQNAALATFASGGRAEIVAALESRPAPWYGHAVGPLLTSMAHPDPDRSPRIPLFLSVPNEGRVAGFRSSDILEIAHHFERGAVVPIGRSAVVAPAVRPLLERFVAYERIAADAVLERDVDTLESALRAHPWVGDALTARSIAADIASGAQAQRASGAASFR